MNAPTQRPVTDRIPPQLYIVDSDLTQYVDVILVVVAFASVKPASVARRCVLTGTIILLAWKRLWRGNLTRSDLTIPAPFGAIVLMMNSSLYESIARTPLGAAMSIGFIDPVAATVIRGRGRWPRAATVLVLAGAACISGLALDFSAPDMRVGVAWILLAVLTWSAYIVVGQKASTTRDGVINLALGCAWDTLFFASILGPGTTVPLTSWELIVIVVRVGLLSTATPYTFEALAMRCLAASTLALFAAILPATSALVGAAMLRQIPGVFKLVGLVLVLIAARLASRD